MGQERTAVQNRITEIYNRRARERAEPGTTRPDPRLPPGQQASGNQIEVKQFAPTTLATKRAEDDGGVGGKWIMGTAGGMIGGKVGRAFEQAAARSDKGVQREFEDGARKLLRDEVQEELKDGPVVVFYGTRQQMEESGIQDRLRNMPGLPAGTTLLTINPIGEQSVFHKVMDDHVEETDEQREARTAGTRSPRRSRGRDRDEERPEPREAQVHIYTGNNAGKPAAMMVASQATPERLQQELAGKNAPQQQASLQQQGQRMDIIKP